MKQEDRVEPPGLIISALEGGTPSNYYQGVWIVLRKTSSWFLRPPDQSLRSVMSGWVRSLLIRDHSSFRVLLHFHSHSGNRPPASVKPASWPGPGGWSHLPFVPFWLPIGNFLTGSHKVGFPTQKISGYLSKMTAPCVKPPEVVVTFHLWALLMRFSHTKSHVYGILLRIVGYCERCKLTRAEQQIQNEPLQTQPSCFPTDSWAVMSLAALTSTVNGMQLDSLSNFRDWLKSS